MFAERGQSIVLVALLFTLLLGFSALAVDGGRFYMERRFLENAADAAALACAQKLSVGGSTTDATNAGTTLLTSYNLRVDPNATGAVVSSTPVYTGWFNANATDKRNLADGVVVSSTDCRVALRTTVRMYFISMVNPGLATLEVPGNAHAVTGGGMLPVVVNRYDNPPGPAGPPFTAGSGFHDYAKQEAQDDVCNDASPSYCPDATTTNMGRERVIVGNGYTASDSDFRGFIALDVRDFSTLDANGNAIHQSYNGAGTMNPNTLKSQEAAYFKTGYPGPDLIAYDPTASPAQRRLQVATMSGNDTGIGVSELKRWYTPGSRILVQLFNGQVQQIPDFTITAPTSINANSPSGSPTTCCAFRVGANQNFTSANDVVDLEMVRDSFVAPDGTSSNDTPSQLQDFAFSPDNFVPGGGLGTQVSLTGFQVQVGLANGIYTVIMRGTGYQPPHPGNGTQLGVHQSWVPVVIGGVTRDFQMTFPATSVDVTGGSSATYTFQLSTGSGSAAWGTGSVSFGIDRGTCGTGQIQLLDATGAQSCGSATISPTSAVPDKNTPPTVTVTVPSTGLGNGAYTFVIRGRGTNSSSQPVVHVQQLQINVNTTAGGGKKYVQVQGYAVFQVVTCTITQDNNAVCGKAVSGMTANPDTLAMGRRARLIPWEDAPY